MMDNFEDTVAVNLYYSQENKDHAIDVDIYESGVENPESYKYFIFEKFIYIFLDWQIKLLDMFLLMNSKTQFLYIVCSIKK